jgi:hypothetical protein
MNQVIVLTLLCEACAEGRGLEADAPLTLTVCADCAKRKACLTTYRPSKATPPHEAPPPPLNVNRKGRGELSPSQGAEICAQSREVPNRAPL